MTIVIIFMIDNCHLLMHMYIRSRACCSHVSWIGARCRCRHGVRWGVGRHSAGICHFSICIHTRREGLENSKVDISNIFEWMMDWCLGNCLNLLACPALERLKLVRHRLEVEKVESLAFPAPWGTITTKKVWPSNWLFDKVYFFFLPNSALGLNEKALARETKQQL